MKLTCTQENLGRGLNLVTHIATKHTTLPILNNVLVKADKGEIRLFTTNLEIGVNCLVRGKVEKEGSFTVSARLFNEYVNSLPKENITLEMLDQALNVDSIGHGCSYA